MMLPPNVTALNAPALKAYLSGFGDAAADLDCRQLERCDVAGLQVLIALRTTLAARGQALKIVNVPADLRWRFVLVGLDTSMPAEAARS